MRSIWLALFFLVAIGALAAFKLGRATPADGQHGSSPAAALVDEGRVDAADAQDDPASKANKLNVSDDGALARKPIRSIAIVPQVTTTALKEEPAKSAATRWRQRYARLSGHRHHHHHHGSG